MTAGAVVLVVAAWMSVQLWERGSDDAYITYTSVRNLLEHGELTFNLGERVFAQSDPGTALLLALVSTLGFSVPGAGTVLTAACLIGAGLSLGKDPWRVLGAGLLLVTSPLLWAGQGLGPVVATVLLMASARLAAARPGVAGAVAAAAVWARPDALIGAGLVWVLGLGRSWRARARFAASPPPTQPQRCSPPPTQPQRCPPTHPTTEVP